MLTWVTASLHVATITLSYIYCGVCGTCQCMPLCGMGDALTLSCMLAGEVPGLTDQ